MGAGLGYFAYDEPETGNLFPLWELPPLGKLKLLQCLSLKDLLALRVVNKGTYDWVNIYVSQLTDVFKHIQIVLKTPEDLEKFTTSVKHLPFINFDIQFNLYRLPRSPAKSIFLKKFAPTIQKLRLESMNLCITEEELEFFHSLTSLRKIHMNKIDICDDEDFAGQVDGKKTRVKMRIPLSFVRHLTRFTYDKLVNNTYAYDILPYCPKLQHFWVYLPTLSDYVKEDTESLEQLSSKKLSRQILHGLRDLIRRRQELDGQLKIALQIVNMQYLVFEDDDTEYHAYLREATAAGVSLFNVEESTMKMLERSEAFTNQEKEDIKQRIISTVTQFRIEDGTVKKNNTGRATHFM